MRKPTPIAESMAWYFARMATPAHLRGPLVNDEPHPGYYERRLAKGAVFVPVRIWIEQNICPTTGDLVDDERLACEVNGERGDPVAQWSHCCGRLITLQQHDYMLARYRWTTDFAPSEPAANPREKIDHLTSPITF